VLALTNAVQPYAWGARDGLARWVGTAASGGPEAELWVGAHPAAPSRLDDGRSLADAVASDPDLLLGPEVVERFGARLPFLLKVLAIGEPLSIQLHPTAEQASEGFAREEASGRPVDDPTRSYRDPFAKPEVLVALEQTWVLTGLRPGVEAAAVLRSLGHAATDALAAQVEGEPDSRAALVHLLTASAADRAVLAEVARSLPAPEDPTAPATDPAGWIAVLASIHPDDPTALAPALLGLRRLEPGEGVFLPAGVPHAYLRGAGIELMGASDNVVRGGLTPKHVDPEQLVTLLAPAGTDVVTLGGREVAPGTRCYEPAAPEILLHRVTPEGGELAAPAGTGPALALAVGGSAEVRAGDGVVELSHGRAALVVPDERATCVVRGTGSVWWATTGVDAGTT
jgi:mannose-6-phosphate isomerase